MLRTVPVGIWAQCCAHFVSFDAHSSIRNGLGSSERLSSFPESTQPGNGRAGADPGLPGLGTGGDGGRTATGLSC